MVSAPISVPEFELARGAAAANFYPVKVIHEAVTDGCRSSGKQKRDNCRDCTCQHGSTWRVAVVCRREARCAPQRGPRQGGAPALLRIIRRRAASGDRNWITELIVGAYCWTK